MMTSVWKPQHYLTPESKGFTGFFSRFLCVFITASFSHAECSFAHAECSFPHAEGGEDGVEDVIGGDFCAGDFVEVMKALAKVFRDEIGGGVVGKGLFCTAQGFE